MISATGCHQEVPRRAQQAFWNKNGFQGYKYELWLRNGAQTRCGSHGLVISVTQEAGRKVRSSKPVWIHTKILSLGGKKKKNRVQGPCKLPGRANTDKESSHPAPVLTVILEKPIRIPRFLSVKASHVLKGFLNKVRYGCGDRPSLVTLWDQVTHGMEWVDRSPSTTKDVYYQLSATPSCSVQLITRPGTGAL